jgi:hypothetical protein
MTIKVKTKTKAKAKAKKASVFKKITFSRFINKVIDNMGEHLRFGQSLMNLLYNVDRDMYFTMEDMEYLNCYNDANITNAIRWLKLNW